MNKKILERLPEAELDIMKVLWSSQKPLKASEIVKSLSDKHSWKVPTAHVLLSRLAEKGFICVDKSSYSHKFIPQITENEYLAQESSNLIKKTGGRLPMMIASLLDSEEVSADELYELSQMLDFKLKELNSKK